MRGPKQLLENEDRLVTRMGAWFPGKRVVFRGKDLFNDLRDQRWMGLLLYGITGRLFNEKQIKLFEGIWTISTSYPDPRLWNNRVTALAGTTRSTGALGVSAAIAVSEASIYGYRPMLRVVDFLLRTQKKLEKGQDLSDIVKEEKNKFRIIFGYGRPIVGTDERINPLLKLADELDYAHGRYVKLAFAVEKILLESQWQLHMNVAALMAALAADQGLTRQQCYHYFILCFTAGMFPCLIDTAEKSEGSFLPLRCNCTTYSGIARRSWE